MAPRYTSSSGCLVGLQKLDLKLQPRARSLWSTTLKRSGLGRRGGEGELGGRWAGVRLDKMVHEIGGWAEPACAPAAPDTL